MSKHNLQNFYLECNGRELLHASTVQDVLDNNCEVTLRPRMFNRVVRQSSAEMREFKAAGLGIDEDTYEHDKETYERMLKWLTKEGYGPSIRFPSPRVRRKDACACLLWLIKARVMV